MDTVLSCWHKEHQSVQENHPPVEVPCVSKLYWVLKGYFKQLYTDSASFYTESFWNICDTNQHKKTVIQYRLCLQP